MKRIISIGLVCLFLCLMGSVIWTEAGASESRVEADVFRYFEREYAEYNDPNRETWSLDEVENVISEMQSLGIPLSDDIMEKLEGYAHDEAFSKYECIIAFLQEQNGPFYRWSVEDKHRSQLLLVSYNLLDEPIFILPSGSDITQERVIETAKATLHERYNISPEQLENYNNYLSFQKMLNSEGVKKVWSIAFEPTAPDLDVFQVLVSAEGEVLESKNLSDRGAWDLYWDYFQPLEEEKGLFSLWPLQEKVWFADQLRSMIKSETTLGDGLNPTIQAILDTPFILPTEQYLTEEEAVALAITAVGKAYPLSGEWVQLFRIGRTLYKHDSKDAIWRISFWHMPGLEMPKAFIGGMVQMDAATGEILSIAANGLTFAETIPYEDRL